MADPDKATFEATVVEKLDEILRLLRKFAKANPWVNAGGGGNRGGDDDRCDVTSSETGRRCTLDAGHFPMRLHNW